MIIDEKKNEVWNCMISLPKDNRPKGITDEQLELIKNDVWKLENFWVDVIPGHGLLERTPQELQKVEKNIYNHCIKKFWEMIVQVLVTKNLLKA